MNSVLFYYNFSSLILPHFLSVSCHFYSVAKYTENNIIIF